MRSLQVASILLSVKLTKQHSQSAHQQIRSVVGKRLPYQVVVEVVMVR